MRGYRSRRSIDYSVELKLSAQQIEIEKDLKKETNVNYRSQLINKIEVLHTHS